MQGNNNFKIAPESCDTRTPVAPTTESLSTALPLPIPPLCNQIKIIKKKSNYEKSASISSSNQRIGIPKPEKKNTRLERTHRSVAAFKTALRSMALGELPPVPVGREKIPRARRRRRKRERRRSMERARVEVDDLREGKSREWRAAFAIEGEGEGNRKNPSAWSKKEKRGNEISVFLF